MTTISSFVQQLDGRPLAEKDLPLLTMLHFGHFSSLQVRNGCVKGAALHLARLRAASQELFGTTLPEETLRDYLRSGVAASPDCSLRINVFTTAPDAKVFAPKDLRVLVSCTEPRQRGTGPLKVGMAVYERLLPGIKHAGIAVASLHHRRLARLQGFDDVLYTDAAGHVLEGSIWNIGFYDGLHFVFPEGPMLDGTALQLMQRGLQQLEHPVVQRKVHRDELSVFSGAFLLNSSNPARIIAQIDETIFSTPASLAMILEQAYEAMPWEPV